MESISQELRRAVLQAAVQGKLTTQLPEDGNSDVLITQIREDKQRIAQEKKIRTGKVLAINPEEETQFEIPSNWQWARLEDVCISVQDGDHQPPPQTTSGVPFLVISNVSSGRIDLSNTRYVSQEYYDSLSFERTGRCGDILFTVTGSYGIAVPVDVEINFCFQRHMALIKPLLNDKYMLAVLKSPCIRSQCDDQATGIAQKTVGIKSLQKMIVPVPPLAEQLRIVARVEELMAKIDELEKAENELKALHQAFPGDMKAALLQAAMQGKLTEQLQEDGTAAELLEKIRNEKERLIREKKIKKEKALDPISVEDTPFDIPTNWEWAYIGDIFEHNAGKALNSKNTNGHKRKYITTSNVYWDHFELENLKEMYYTDDEIEKYSVRRGDLLVLEGGDVGRSAIWDRDESYCVQNHLHRLRAYMNVNIKYFYYCMMYFKLAGMVNGKGIAIQGLSANALHSIVTPIPPLAEQHRIVERLDKLLPLCDSLQVNL